MSRSAKTESAPPPRARKPRPSLADRADPHRLYEQSVQDEAAEVDFVDRSFKALRGRQARSLREDFCGTANVCYEWVSRRRDNQAVGVDLEPSVLAWSRTHKLAALKPAAARRVRLLEGNVLSARCRAVDVLLAMNFSYWLFKTRAELRDYFIAARRNLKADGVFFLDCYGGYDAFRVLRERRTYRTHTYVWDQASYNPVTGHITCHIHFDFRDGSRLPQAFTYDWRLWTLPELREVLEEAGFARSVVYWQGWDPKTGEPDGDFQPTEVADADAGWLAYIAAVK